MMNKMGQIIENLKNIQPLQLNNSLINNSDVIVQNLISNANTSTDGVWFIIVSFALYIWLMFVFMRQDGGFRFDLPRTLLISSGWTLMVSIGAVLFTLSNTLLPVIWYSTIFFISGIMVLRRMEKGQ